MRTTATKVALSLAVVVYAFLAIGSGLDRLSAQAPPLERLVPRPLRAQADRSAAQLAALRNARGPMLSYARAAVAADPIDPASASLLGAALLLQGSNAGAERAFRVAARFGWRDIPTQAYWYDAAVQAGEMEPAADRLDALLRAQPGLPNSESLLRPLESTAAGRRALELKLAERPDWLPAYLQLAGLPEGALERRTTVLTELAGSGTRLGCDTIGKFVADTLAAGARAQAEQVWVAHCPGARIAGGLADPGFDTFGTDQASPFEWQAPPSGDVTIEPIASPSGNRLVRLSNTASVSRPVLVQPIALKPGHYRLTAKSRPGRLAASLGCGTAPALPHAVTGDLAGTGQVLDVPVCARLSLGLWLRPDSHDVDLDDVRLERVS